MGQARHKAAKSMNMLDLLGGANWRHEEIAEPVNRTQSMKLDHDFAAKM